MSQPLIVQILLAWSEKNKDQEYTPPHHVLGLGLCHIFRSFMSADGLVYLCNCVDVAQLDVLAPYCTLIL